MATAKTSQGLTLFWEALELFSQVRIPDGEDRASDQERAKNKKYDDYRTTKAKSRNAIHNT